ncbi:phosphopantetheine binding protein [Breoghania corrubedonensis]|uniref:Phosphopantetheine binding protein n=1 Tax=Breoghania corrubedonensis TaxID=665038 RepID=A0A2T5VFT0_9HYPH|nr:acyl carrier protein [Breoghania corrubedonensis]PTW62588.1 phosphopantetheine binding protein [Breoghania corrubedonensis]
MTENTKRGEVAAFLTQRLAEITKRDPSMITGSSVFVDMGLQSIDAVLLCGEVEDKFDIELDPASIFEHDTLDSFLGLIDERIAAQ